MNLSRKNKGEFSLNGNVYEFHQGRYRASIELKTPDGRITKLESDDFNSPEEANASLKSTLDGLLESFTKEHGVEIVSRKESQT